MRVCASYHIPPTMWTQVDELRFSTQALAQAIPYMEEHRDKKVIIEILDLNDCGIAEEKLKTILAENENMYLDCYSIEDFMKLSIACPSHCMYHYPVNTYNMLYFLLQYPISDITIGEPLNFDLDRVVAAVRQYDRKVKIRVIPAFGRPSLFNNIADVDNGIRHFWILPQHMSQFEDYIDVVDLLSNNTERETTLVRVFLKGSYTRELSYYLENCESGMLCDLITNEFVKRRLNCGQRCMQTADSSYCHYCQSEEALYHRLRERQASDNPIKPQSK